MVLSARIIAAISVVTVVVVVAITLGVLYGTGVLPKKSSHDDDEAVVSNFHVMSARMPDNILGPAFQTNISPDLQLINLPVHDATTTSWVVHMVEKNDTDANSRWLTWDIPISEIDLSVGNLTQHGETSVPYSGTSADGIYLFAVYVVDTDSLELDPDTTTWQDVNTAMSAHTILATFTLEVNFLRSFNLTSISFANGDPIPVDFVSDTSPPFTVPEVDDQKSYVLCMKRGGDLGHITSASVRGIVLNLPSKGTIDTMARELWTTSPYVGMDTPDEYQFIVYVVNMVSLTNIGLDPRWDNVWQAMVPHVVASSAINCTFSTANFYFTTTAISEVWISSQFGGSNAPSPNLTFENITANEIGEPNYLHLFCVDNDVSFFHWFICDVPVVGNSLWPDNFDAASGQGVRGLNDFLELGWGGPQPPAGETHTYQFVVVTTQDPYMLTEGYDSTEFFTNFNDDGSFPHIASYNIIGRFTGL
jgi:phosphatidylethanolamine-binding protein (PEBP) family uncharacterized protein